METYIIKIGNKEYTAINGIYAQPGDKVAYSWNPNDEINIMLRLEGDQIVTHSGRGDADKWHKIID